MNSRTKTFGVLAILGFIAGIIALLIANYIAPKLDTILQTLGGITQYIIAGLAGAIITIIIVIIWAHITGNKNNTYY
ncbi:MAG: hypothetical protein LBC03_07160 [Nitrososphaerota archaeon]|jgi:uncharacterized membrane protein YeaQ/YmgE (transglycosylase-associated protein family)|nr:hypothetical protein [Nitrososphaerota archaeon]